MVENVSDSLDWVVAISLDMGGSTWGQSVGIPLFVTNRKTFFLSLFVGIDDGNMRHSFAYLLWCFFLLLSFSLSPFFSLSGSLNGIGKYEGWVFGEMDELESCKWVSYSHDKMFLSMRGSGVKNRYHEGGGWIWLSTCDE